MKDLYLFTARVYIEEKDTDEDTYGFVIAENYGDAAAQIEEQYGPILTGITFLSLCYDVYNGVSEVSEDLFNQIRKELKPLTD